MEKWKQRHWDQFEECGNMCDTDIIEEVPSTGLKALPCANSVFSN